jgi:SRSO17 transposase
LRSYCTGLLLPGERKSIEPMAARLDPRHVQATHQSLHHSVAKAPWDDAAVLTAVREQVLPALTRHGPITAWILDDTGFPKKGTHSVGVARQFCGQLGKQDNCQVAVSLSLANDGSSLPVAFDLYRPEEWANDPVRRATAGVPKTLAFRTKPQIALEQIRRALAEGLPPGVVLGDAAYGVETDFRTALTAVSLSYVLGVHWRLAAGMRSLAAQAGQGAPAQAPAPGCRASAGQRQGPRLDPAAKCLADGGLARGQPG